MSPHILKSFFKKINKTQTCVNPNHLFLGTRRENNIDKVKKQRQAKHERNGTSKLRENQIEDIKFFYNNKIMDQFELSRRYKIDKSQISRIVNLKAWI